MLSYGEMGWLLRRRANGLQHNVGAQGQVTAHSRRQHFELTAMRTSLNAFAQTEGKSLDTIALQVIAPPAFAKLLQEETHNQRPACEHPRHRST